MRNTSSIWSPKSYSIRFCPSNREREVGVFTENLHSEDSLRKHPFLLALRRWGRFARMNDVSPREMSLVAKSKREKRMFSPRTVFLKNAFFVPERRKHRLCVNRRLEWKKNSWIKKNSSKKSWIKGDGALHFSQFMNGWCQVKGAKKKWKDLLAEANKRRYLLDIYGTDSVSAGAGITNIVQKVLVPVLLYIVIQLLLISSRPCPQL